jgi:hypothetical protein
MLCGRLGRVALQKPTDPAGDYKAAPACYGAEKKSDETARFFGVWEASSSVSPDDMAIVRQVAVRYRNVPASLCSVLSKTMNVGDTTLRSFQRAMSRVM